MQINKMNLITNNFDYNIFLKFTKTFTPNGFKNIVPTDPLMLDLENMMKKSNQFFYIADVITIKILFTSKGSMDMIGVEPIDVSFYTFMEMVHPDDIQRLNLGRASVFKVAQELFIAEKGYKIMSTNYRFRNTKGNYSNILVQCYLYYTTIPYKTVYFLKIHTNIDNLKKPVYGYHFYNGGDISYFRYPDLDLLNVGNVFSRREFEIIKLIEKEFSSEDIGKQLFVSRHTVDTHRRNILRKTNKNHISELIYELKEKGVL